MVLPNVLVIGAQKCGTTATYQLIRQHPQCVAGTVKESHFFVDESPWGFGNWHRGLDWYSSLYDHEAAIVADVCPSYSGWPVFPGVPERASSVVPDATIVMLVRDPVDRMVSHWRHWVWRGYETRSCEEALLDPAPDNLYLVGSSYASQLERWRMFYDATRTLVLTQADVRVGALALFAHFGLPPSPLEASVANVTDEKRIARFSGLPSSIRRRVPARWRTRPVPKPVLSDRAERVLLDRVRDDATAFAGLTGVSVLRERRPATA